MTEVFINNSLIDIEQTTTIVASYGNIFFGELGKRSGAKTNNFAAPFSQRNKLVFESCEQVSSWSIIPYRRGNIRVDIGGLTVFEGFCILDQAKEGYEILSFAGATDFYSIVTTVKLNQIDLSFYDHVWNETVIQGSWLNTSGYIYAFVEYNKHFNNNVVPPEYLLPQIFFKDVIQAIVKYAGYTISGKVLNNLRYKNHVIIPGVFPRPFTYGNAVTLTAYLPDVLMSKVWLDFANIYGLQFAINDQTKEIVANYIDDLLFNPSEDWTDKVDKSERHTTKFRFDDYGQKSYLRYADVKVNNFLTLTGFSKEVLIDDSTLKATADVYKSEFSIIQADTFLPSVYNTFSYNSKAPYFNFEIWNSATPYFALNAPVVWYFGSYYVSILDGTNKIPSANPTYWDPISEDDLWNYIPRNLYGTLELFPGSVNKFRASTGDITIPHKITNNKMDWEYIYFNHYRVFDRIVKRTKLVDMLLKLNSTDISQLDFTRPKLIDGELYVLQNVDQYKLNQHDSTIVNLARL